MNIAAKLALMLSLAAALPGSMLAQDIYDDLYDVPARRTSNTNTGGTDVSRISIVTNSPTRIDIDTYNRRGFFADDAANYYAIDTAAINFNNTQRIQRFHNSDVIVSQSDTTLTELYDYSVATQPSVVNIYVNDYSTPYGYYNSTWGITPYYSYAWPYYSAWNSPWYYSWYSPWYTSWYSPWYDLCWGWTWGPSWSCHPPYPGHGHGHGWGRPYNPRHPGALASGRPGYGGRPGGDNRPGGSNPGVTNGYRPGMGGSQPGVSAGPGRHPQSGGQNTRPSGGHGGYRPGATQTPSVNAPSGVRPSNNNGGYRPGRNQQSGNSTRPSGGNNSRPSYSAPSHNSGSFGGGGGRHGGGGGGGGHHGGGGGGRGGRH